MNNICIIPARYGSKRVKDKNVRLFHGKPIIEYALDTANNSKLFNTIEIFTNDTRIVGKYTDFVTTDRSQVGAGDNVSLTDTLLEALRLQIGTFDNICLLLPTAVFVNHNDLLLSYGGLKYADSVVSMTQFKAPIERSFDIRPDGFAELCFPYNEFKRTQEFTPKYHDAGQFYWLNYKEFMKQKRIFMIKIKPYIIDAIDIDSEYDFKKAEALYEYTRLLV